MLSYFWTYTPLHSPIRMNCNQYHPAQTPLISAKQSHSHFSLFVDNSGQLFIFGSPSQATILEFSVVSSFFIFIRVFQPKINLSFIRCKYYKYYEFIGHFQQYFWGFIGKLIKNRAENLRVSVTVQCGREVRWSFMHEFQG